MWVKNEFDQFINLKTVYKIMIWDAGDGYHVKYSISGEGCEFSFQKFASRKKCQDFIDDLIRKSNNES